MIFDLVLIRIANDVLSKFMVSQTVAHFLRALHWSTLGQIKHSSCVNVLPGGAFKSPLKCAHLAGESKTVGYSIALTFTIFSLAVSNSNLDMQNGQA